MPRFSYFRRSRAPSSAAAGPHPARHRAQDELLLDRAGQNAGKRRLARPRRPPQDQRTHPASLHHRPERPALSRQVRLADYLIQSLGTKAFGERGAPGEAVRAGLVEEVHDTSIPATRLAPSPVLRVVFVVFAALAVHAAGGFEDIFRVEAFESAGLQDLIHGVLRDHHPLRRVRQRQRPVEHAAHDPYYPPPRP
ncbi:MAG: hypothetical protein WKF28_00340 [Rubrobacteraceae bacterium]